MTRYNGTFDALRGWAAFGVVGFHCNSSIPFGWMGLLFFYVLSGYLVGRSFQMVTRGVGGVGEVGWWGRLFILRSYFMRRVLRVFPLYYFYLGGLVLLAIFGMVLPYFWGDFPSLFFGYYAWVPIGGMSRVSLWYAHLWALSVELQFYCLLPVFFFCVPPWWRARVLWIFVVGTPLLRVFVYNHFIAQGEWVASASVYGAPTNYLDAFALGVLLSIIPRKPEALARRDFLLYTGGLFAFLLGFGLVVSPGEFWWRSLGFPFLETRYWQWCWGYTFLHLFFYFLVGWVATSPAISVLLDNKMTRYLGERSYGIYVYHAVPTALLIYFMGYTPSLWGEPIPFYIVFIAYGIASILAILSFRFVERPFLLMRIPMGYNLNDCRVVPLNPVLWDKPQRISTDKSLEGAE